jgi:hypothetical protein
MTTSSVVSALASERNENFPIDSFRHLEGMLQRIRRRVMADAAGLADREDPNGIVFTVKRHHVDEALCSVLSNWETLRRVLGLQDD